MSSNLIESRLIVGGCMKNVERESRLQEKIMQRLRASGIYVYKNAQNMYTETGRPDLCACIPVSISTLQELYGVDAKVGLFVGLELKRDGHLNEVSDAQKIVGRKILNANGIWLPVDSIETVDNLLVMLRVGEVEDAIQ